jgi:multiple sugar transport system permease protein
MAVTYAGRSIHPVQRGAATRFLEDERRLAMVLLLPTIALLGLFIAYPFMKGVCFR